jgi:glycerol uptake facilitator-like aquaporin
MMETREVMERWQSWVFIWIAAPFVGATLGIILCDIFAL